MARMILPASCTGYGEMVLTTDHSASSYGIPVVLIGQDVYKLTDNAPTVADDPLPNITETVARAVMGAAYRSKEQGGEYNSELMQHVFAALDQE